jgi:hypothetical protein
VCFLFIFCCWLYLFLNKLLEQFLILNSYQCFCWLLLQFLFHSPNCTHFYLEVCCCCYMMCTGKVVHVDAVMANGVVVVVVGVSLQIHNSGTRWRTVVDVSPWLLPSRKEPQHSLTMVLGRP